LALALAFAPAKILAMRAGRAAEPAYLKSAARSPQLAIACSASRALSALSIYFLQHRHEVMAAVQTAMIAELPFYHGIGPNIPGPLLRCLPHDSVQPRTGGCPHIRTNGTAILYLVLKANLARSAGREDHFRHLAFPQVRTYGLRDGRII
jgi:hypothetical protein